MTEVNCKICDKKIKFDPNNPKTYINKSESGNLMIGKLFTIRIGHQADSGKSHINVIVIDEQGAYRAHKDYYEEKESLEGTPDLWNDLQHDIPTELRPYLALANSEEKKILTAKCEPFKKTVIEWYDTLIELKNSNPHSQFFKFLGVKWGFIIGKGKDIIDYKYEPDSWSYLLYLRLLARFKPSPDLLEQAKKVDMGSSPILIQLEAAIAKAEVFLRLSAYEDLELLYSECKKKWGNQTSIEMKSGMMLLQGYYGFRLYFLQRISDAINLIEPVFNFGQITENREIISVAGNFYAAVIQSSGDLEKALNIFEIVLKVSEDMGDERTKVVISTNMSVIESKQGLYDEALKRQQNVLTLPIVQAEFFLKISIMSIYAETLFIAEHYDESRKVCQTLLLEKEIPTYYKIDVLSTLKRTAGKTHSHGLLTLVRNNLPADKDFMDSPVGHIFMHDLEAIDGELHHNWIKLINNLNKEREIMFKNQSVENASDIEIRLAEAYFKYFQDTKKLEHLNHSYNHLDLAKTIALENQSYLDLCRLVMLKGLLAAESKLPEQAKVYFEEALKTAREYNLSNLEKEINENLEQLDTGIIEKSANSILRRMFNRLTFRKSEELKSKKESNIYTMFIGTHDSAWELILQNEKSGSWKDINYILGFHDLWNNIRNNMIQHQINYFTVSRGAVLIENSAHFQLFALCDQLDYMTRLKIQNLLPELENFSFRHIPEELEKKVLNSLKKDIGKFSKVENY
ncbi:MAG: hypothetical protein ACFFBF_00945 [Promethearchaeota archaeon]